MKRNKHILSQPESSFLRHPFVVTVLYIFALLFAATPFALGNSKINIMSVNHEITQQVLESNKEIHLFAAATCFTLATVLVFQILKTRFFNHT